MTLIESEEEDPPPQKKSAVVTPSSTRSKNFLKWHLVKTQSKKLSILSNWVFNWVCQPVILSIQVFDWIGSDNDKPKKWVKA